MDEGGLLWLHSTAFVHEIIDLGAHWFDSTTKGGAWVMLTDAERRILDKMQAVGRILKDWDVSINYGIKTGFNEAFIIDGAAKDALIAEDAKSAEIIKPLLRGRDIKRCGVEFADLWIIATLPTLRINIDEYPAIKKYLSAFRPRIDQTGERGSRKFTHNKWFETQDAIAYYKDFEKPKICWIEICDNNQFHLDTEKYYNEATSFIMTRETVNLAYLIGILNSKAIKFALHRISTATGMGTFRWKKVWVEQLPIPLPSAANLPSMAGPALRTSLCP